MIFPKRDSVYQNLNTSFTNFEELLLDLKDNGFTGVVQVSYWEYEGVLLLDNGTIINAIEEIGETVLTGQSAVASVTKKAKEKDGAISVFSQKGDMITMLASVAKSEILYENLSTEFTSLDALISKLQSEDHTGYIEVAFAGNGQKGFIFLLAGRVIEALLSVRGEEVSGATVINRILELTSSTGAVFSVYKAAVEDALSESEMIKASSNLPQLLEVWGGVIKAVESAVDSLLGKDEFLNGFKDVLIEKADIYPFLDPFAAKFIYAAGEVTFSGDIQENFSQAIGDCLWTSIEIFAERAALNEKDLFGPVHSALDEVKVNYKSQIAKFAFAGIMPELFG